MAAYKNNMRFAKALGNAVGTIQLLKQFYTAQYRFSFAKPLPVSIPNAFAALSLRTQAILCVLFSVCVWAGWMIISSYSVRRSLTAYDITALRFGVAGLILMPVLIKKGLRIGPHGIWGSLAMAFLLGAPFNIITIFGMKFAPASHAAGLINTTMLTVVTLGSILLLREATTRLRIAGIVVSIVGIACLLYSAKHATVSDNATLGHLMFMLGGAMWAGYALCAKAWKTDPLHATAIVCSMSCLMYLPIYFLFLPSHIGMDNLGEVVFQGTYQGLINSVFALLCFNRGIAILGASTASAFLPLIPVLATLLAIPLLGEIPGAQEMLGILLAATGVFLATGTADRLLIRKSITN